MPPRLSPSPAPAAHAMPARAPRKPRALQRVVFGITLAALAIGLGALGTIAAPLGPFADAPDAAVDLAASIVAPEFVAPGGSLAYSIAVTNTGSAAAGAAVLTATLPADLVLAGTPPGVELVGPGVLRWSLEPLPPGGRRDLALVGRVPIASPAGQALDGKVEVASIEEDGPTEDNHGAARSQVEATDLRVEIGSAATEVLPGALVTHSLTLFNVSRAAAEAVTMTLGLGGGAGWVSDTAAAAGFTRATIPGGLRWTRPSLPGVATLHFELATRVPADAPPGSTIVHTLQVAAATLDGQPGNNSASAAPLTVVLPDLWVSKTGPAEAGLGDGVTFELAYGNRGSGAAPSARLTDTLPAGLSYVSAMPPASVIGGRTLVWDLGRVPAGAEDLVRVQARVDAGQPARTTLVNHASIGPDRPDGRPADNSASATLRILPGSPASVELSVPAELDVGLAPVAVTATVRDAAGNPVADGTIVSFSSVLGDFVAPSVPTEGGVALGQWRTGTKPGPTSISARAAAATGRGTVTLRPGPPDRLQLDASLPSPTVGQTVTLEARLEDAFGNPVRDGTPLTFEVELGNLAPAGAPSVGGKASAAWRVTRAGTWSATARAGEIFGTLRLNFAADAPALVSVSTGSSELPVDEGRTTIWASVDDRFGNPAADGLEVRFSSPGGSFAPALVPTAGGLASTEFRAGPAAGGFVVSAQVQGLVGNRLVTLRPANLILADSRVEGPRGPAPTAQLWPGDRLSYALTVRNDGAATARRVILGAALEGRFALESIESTRPVESVAPPPGLVKTPGEHYLPRAWRLPDLAPREAVTLTLVANIERDPARAWTGFDTLFARAAVTSTTAEASPADLIRTNKAEVHMADLFIDTSFASSASQIRPGGVLVYDIGFGNGGTGLVPQALITATLPAWARFQHWQADQQVTGLRELDAFGPESRLLVWAYDGGFGLSQGLRLWLDIDPEAPPEAVLELMTAIGSATPELDTVDNFGYPGSVRLRGVNLRGLIAAPETVGPGGLIAWDFGVRNGALQDSATDVVVEALLPEDLAIERIDPAPSEQVGGRLRWLIEQPLLPGAERRFAVTTRVPEAPAIGTLYRASLRASGGQPDSFPGDNEALHSVRVVPGAPATLALIAGAPSLTACTDERMDLLAEVRDSAGNPVPDGTPVRWSASAGSLSAAETTTAGGVAAVLLSAAREAWTATVTARAGPAQAEATVAMLPGPPGQLALTTEAAAVDPGQEVLVTVRVRDACDNPVADRWPIQLSTVRGEWPGGGLSLALPTVGGAVSAPLWVGTEPGPLAIGARHGEIASEAEIQVRDRPPRWAVFVPFALQVQARGRAGRP